MAQKIKYVYDEDGDNIHEIPAKLLNDGDFFIRGSSAYFFEGKYSNILESELRVKRLCDMKTFTINPNDMVKVYRKISIVVERI